MLNALQEEEANHFTLGGPSKTNGKGQKYHHNTMGTEQQQELKQFAASQSSLALSPDSDQINQQMAGL